MADYIVPILLLLVSAAALRRKENPYDLLLMGAADGLKLLVTIVPSLVMLLTAVTMLRQSGAVEILNEIPELKLENIFLGATHTHSAPANRFTDNEAEGKYRQEFIAYMPMVAKQAIKDLAPATVEACKFDIEGMNFVRHYIMNDGTIGGSNWTDDLAMTEQADGTWKSNEAYAIGDTDEFKVRQGGSWDVNYGADGVMGGANIVVDADGKYQVKLTLGDAVSVELIPVN